jgi:hypothetical protein
MTTLIAYKKNIVKTAMVAMSIGVLVLGVVVLDGWANETIKSVMQRDMEAREQARRDAEAKEKSQREAEAKEKSQREAKAREETQRKAKAREEAQRKAQAKEEAEREARAKAVLEAAGVMAMTPEMMTWEDAKEYCESKGFRLPRVAGRKDWYGDGRGSAVIEVFGAVGSPWPSWLPSNSPYWTGTRSMAGPNRQWDVRNNGGRVDVGSNSRHRRYPVVCARNR